MCSKSVAASAIQDTQRGSRTPWNKLLGSFAINVSDTVKLSSRNQNQVPPKLGLAAGLASP